MAITDIFDTTTSRKSYKYSAIPDAGEHGGSKGEAVAWQDGGRKRSLKKLAVVGFLVAAAVFFVIGYLRTGSTDSCDSAKNGFQCAPEISHSWGQYSPYYSVPSAASRSTPKDCRVTFAQVLSRHGARDPTASKTVLYSAIIQRIHDNVRDYGKHYEFIKNYQYKLGADELSLFGQRQMVNSGIKFYKRYRHLTRDHSPYVRSAGQNRVVESALNWTQGFHETRRGDGQTHAPDAYPYRVLVIPEDAGVNNTLSHGNCKAFEDGPASEVGNEAQRTWLDRFAPPVAEKLNRNLPGANLSLPEVIYFMDLCPFNTVADPNGRLSPFCHLFTRDEWHGYDYFQSLGKWYGYGNGNPLGPSQGVGFVNELVARLTGRPVVDETTTNSTLDGSDQTFPLGKALYADFSHDNDMVGVMAALGLYNATEPLSKTAKASPKDTKGYAASWTVPFAARMYVEKMQCEDSDEELVRVLVNDRVIPLQNCGADVLGRCELSRFVDSLSFARDGGRWEQCFV